MSNNAKRFRWTHVEPANELRSGSARHPVVWALGRVQKEPAVPARFAERASPGKAWAGGRRFDEGKESHG